MCHSLAHPKPVIPWQRLDAQLSLQSPTPRPVLTSSRDICVSCFPRLPALCWYKLAFQFPQVHSGSRRHSAAQPGMDLTPGGVVLLCLLDVFRHYSSRSTAPVLFSSLTTDTYSQVLPYAKLREAEAPSFSREAERMESAPAWHTAYRKPSRIVNTQKAILRSPVSSLDYDLLGFREPFCSSPWSLPA